MNKHSYKLIFSKSKGCLIPVAEFINSVTEKSQSERKCNIKVETHRLSAISVAISQLFKPSNYFPLFLLGMPVLSLANPVEVDDAFKNKTAFSITNNKVVLVDIATPENDGISDNRFKTFNVENGAVFKNNKEAKQSTLVGHLEKNPHLTDKAAKAILTQVTGDKPTNLQGGLEVLGEKADLLVVNPNGVTINGVQTFNTDRFVASTSEVIDPKKGLNLNVSKGKLTIGEKGLSTDGLSYVDLVAKKIEQKGAVKPNTNSAKTATTNVTFVAGESQYDVKNQKVTSKNSSNNNEVILSGEETASMYGDKIRFVVTETGAGVNHKGIILANSDIQIESKKGNVEVNQLQTSKNIKVTNSKAFVTNKEIAAQNIELNSDKVTLKQSILNATQTANITTQDLKLEGKSKVSGRNVAVKSANVSVDTQSNIVATELTISADRLNNNGTISAVNNVLDSNFLRNQGTISAKENLNIKVVGEGNKTYAEPKFEVIRSNYVNLGTIQSEKKAELTFKNNSSFSAVAHINRGLPQAKERLTINANYFDVENGQKIELDNNFTINAQHINNNGTLTTGGYLDISSKFDIENNGLLGAGKGYRLVSKQANITNGPKGILHSEGSSFLDAEYKVANDGKILSKDKLTVQARYLLNNVTLSGNLKSLSSNHTHSLYYRRNSVRNDFYQLETILNDFNASELKIANLGQVRANDFEFIQKSVNGDEVKGIDNFGIINIQGTFHNNGTARIHNGLKGIRKNLIDDYFNNYNNDIVLKFQPRSQILFISGPLSGQTSARYATLGLFLDGLLSRDATLSSSAYSGYYHQYLKLLKSIKSEQLQNALTQVLGQNWDTQSREVLKGKWEEAKNRKDQYVYFYPAGNAKILANQITGTITKIQNGYGGQDGKFDHSINVGEHTINVPRVSFKTFNTQEIEKNVEIDLSILLDVLSSTDLFIDRSLQLEPKALPPVSLADDELLKMERERKALEERHRKEQEALVERLRKDAEERARLQREKEELDKKKREEELARQLEEQQRLEKERQRLAEVQRKREQDALRLKEEIERSKREKALLEEQLRQESIDKQRKIELEKERARLAEEQRKREQDELRLREEIARYQREQELIRQAKEAERLKEQQRLLEEQRKREENAKRIQEESERQQRELKDRQEQERRAFEESIRQEKERQKAREKSFQEQANSLLTGKNRPRVQIDPLYHTRVKYIKQDDYVGANYFFNQVATPEKNTAKVKVIGDNYFEHQLITRTIEKKVDNHLSLKYNLKNNELVKRLMDNAAHKAKSLNLEVGKALTKEQQENLDEDIIWYVQSEVNGQKVFVPQVYLAKQTLENAKKFRGLGNSVIRANEIALKTDALDNSGVISANKLSIEATDKIRTDGDILAGSELKLKGHKGIEVISRVETDEKGNTVTRQANVASDGHLHLETDLDSNIDLRAANVKGSTGFIKANDVNVKESYNTATSHKSQAVISRLTGANIGLKTETISKVDAVGSNVNVGHLHLAVGGDLNQHGSTIDTERTTGVVKGNVITKSGKHLESVKRTEDVIGIEFGGRASGLGHSVSVNVSEQEGVSTDKSRSDASGVNLDGGLVFRRKTETETSLTHSNSQLNAKSGELHVLGNADIGGVDINKGVEVAEKSAAEQQPDTATAQLNKLALQTVDQVLAQKNKALKGLSDQQVEQLMAEKDAQFFEREKQKKDEGFTLSANSISSTKAKDEHSRESHSFGIKIGGELEAHSAILDAVSGVAKEVLDAKDGLKQDGTIVLQHASEVANLVTGDLIGASGKRKIEVSMSSEASLESRDVRSHLGGKTTLVARDGDLTLNNVESNEHSQLTLTAKDNVNINSGKTETTSRSTSFTQKVYDGSSASCGVMSQGCAVGVSGGFDANINVKKAEGEQYQNSQLKGSQIVINSGKDLNLKGANVEADQVNLDVAGKTRIESVQDRSERSEIDVNIGASAGASINTSLQIKPTGSITAGVGYEYENSKKVAQQSGISADRIVGTINDLELKAGHIVDRSQGKDLTIKGSVSHENLQDHHHKDGGSFGGTVGINERGTAQLNLRGGRTEQIHYDATQKSTLSAGEQGKMDGLNRDISQAKSVQRDDRIASSKFEFEVLDLAELGQKAKNKLSSGKAKAGGDLQNSAANSPLYEDVAPSPYGKVGDANADFRRAKPADDGVYSEVQLPKAKAEPKANAEPIYEEIASSPYGKVGDNNADFRRAKPADEGVYSEVQPPKNKVESVYAEVTTPSTKSVESVYAEVGAGKASTQDSLYAQVDKSPQAKAKAEARTADIPLAKKTVESNDVAPALPKRPQLESSDTTNVEQTSQTNSRARRALPELPQQNADAGKVKPAAEGDYAEIPAVTAPQTNSRARRALPELPQQNAEAGKAKPAAESDYAEIPAVTAPQSNSRAKRALPELPQQNAEAGKAKPAAESDYAEIPAVTEQAQSNNRAKRALPEVPQQNAETGKAKPAVESDYAEIPALTPRAKSSGASDYEEIPNLAPKAKVETEVETAEQPKVALKVDDSLYAKVDKSPEAKAKADARTADIPLTKKAVAEVEEAAPALPKRPQAAQVESVEVTKTLSTVETVPVAETVAEQPAAVQPKAKVEKAESESLLGKIKRFFKGSSESSNAKKAAKPEPKAAQDETPNYDNLADNLNLKGLVELENQRNTDFGEKVLKNPEFLAEAKEAAKKYIPEATIKQMGDSPEFNDILTEGARKVEQRINDAVTFKPTVDEFNAIQGLVKQLPKGTVLDDINARTDSITDALASTSKTIQKNPELKELIRGAIDGFLKESAGQDLTVEMIEKLNKGLRPDEQGDFTLYKKETLTKENAVFSSPEASKIQLAETVAFINKAKADNIEPSVLAGLVYQRLIAYHPFAEGNGRMARVIVNKILLDAGYPPFTKFSDTFETQIIPQTNSTAKSATSSEVVSEFLRELGQKNLPAGSEPIVRQESESQNLQKVERSHPLVEATAEPQAEPKALEVKAPEEADTTKKRETPINDKVQAKELVEKPRSLTQQIKDSFQPLRVGKKIKDVRESVEKYGGEVSFKFAQSKGEVFNEIIKHAETEHGACEATCAFWIAKKVNDDQSLFKEIYPEGKAGKLDKKAFEQIKKLQTDFINSGSSATQQFKFTESWLNEQGVNVKQKKVGEYSKKDEVSGTVTNKDVKALTKAILETGGDQAGVKKISINLQGGSHTVAAAVQGEKVVFFDPNFGEITFKSHQQFENWFKEAFWSKSGYAGTDSGKRFFNVINYDAK